MATTAAECALASPDGKMINLADIRNIILEFLFLRIGKTCDCNLQQFESSVELLNQCRGESEFDELGPICSDRGECFCGQCLCNPGFEGPHCECSECTP